MTLVVRAGRDCATRIRRVYTIGRPLEREDAAFLEGATVEFHEFSAFVATARDHVRIRLGSAVEASFSVGEDELTIAYGKLGSDAPSALVDATESRLVAYLDRTRRTRVD